MTIEQIKYFLALEKYKNFSQASYELCISQSSLSKQIKSLEDKLNVVLFDRTTRSVELTSAGELFLDYAKNFIDDYNSMVSQMKNYSKDCISKIDIGTIPVMAQYNITPKIILFKNKRKNININIIEKESNEVLNLVKEKKIDLAFVRNINLKDDSLDVLNLIDDELVLVTSKDHPFSKKKYVSFEDLKNEEFILLGENSGIYDRVIEECKKHNFSPKVSYKMYKIETILGLVSENLGISILMKKVLNSFNTSNVSMTLLKEQVILPLSVVYNKNIKLSKECKEFIDFIKNKEI